MFSYNLPTYVFIFFFFLKCPAPPQILPSPPPLPSPNQQNPADLAATWRSRPLPGRQLAGSLQGLQRSGLGVPRPLPEGALGRPRGRRGDCDGPGLPQGQSVTRRRDRARLLQVRPR